MCSPHCLSPSFHFSLHFSTTKFLDAVFKQTNIVPHHQEYFFEGHLYELDPNLQAHNFCKTTECSPLTLLSTSEQPEDVVGVRYRDRECHSRRVAVVGGICCNCHPKRFPISQLGDGPVSCMIPGRGAWAVLDLNPSFTRPVPFPTARLCQSPFPVVTPVPAAGSTGSQCQFPLLVPAPSANSQSCFWSLGQGRSWSRIRGSQGQFPPALCWCSTATCHTGPCREFPPSSTLPKYLGGLH